MPSHTSRHRRRPELQANRKTEPSREAAIDAQLRALSAEPCARLGGLATARAISV